MFLYEYRASYSCYKHHVADSNIRLDKKNNCMANSKAKFVLKIEVPGSVVDGAIVVKSRACVILLTSKKHTHTHTETIMQCNGDKAKIMQ